jgi:hypothetical protein
MTPFERPQAEIRTLNNQDFIIGKTASIIIEGGSDVDGIVVSTEIVGSDTFLVLEVENKNHSFVHHGGVWSEQIAQEEQMAA